MGNDPSHKYAQPASRSGGGGWGKSPTSSGVSVTGISEIDKRIKALAEDVRQKVVKRAMVSALKDLWEDARLKAPKHTGRLAKSISRRFKLSNNGETATGSVYSYQGRGSRSAPHAWLVHEGSSVRVADHTWVRRVKGKTYVTVRGQSFGRILPDPFMRRAFLQNRHSIRGEFVKALRVAIDKVSR